MAGASDIGRRRKTNQDSLFFDEVQGLGVVADGIGGRNSGEIASALVVDGVKQGFLDTDRIRHEEVSAFLITTVERLNREIISRGKEHETERGMGTTVNCVFFGGERIHIAHVGDSRTYLYFQGGIWQLTIDHNVREFRRRGLLSESQISAGAGVKEGALTRALGLTEQCDVDLYDMELQPGQIFITCSDGLTGMVDDRKIARIVREHERDLKNIPKALIDAANKAGGVDNITILVSQVRGD